MSMGTMHGTEIFPIVCPDISRDTARDIAAVCIGLRSPGRRLATTVYDSWVRPPSTTKISPVT